MMRKVLALVALSCFVFAANAFNLVFMGRRRGTLKNNLDDKNSQNPAASINKGRGQEITGVTLPAEGTIKGWAFGDDVSMACANVDGKFYAVQGDCPRCGFDLWKGDLIYDDPAWDDLPRVACPTCSTTFGMRSGQKGPPIKRKGLQAFVGGLAQTATSGAEAVHNAKAFIITRDEEDGRVYCRER